jgi:hypothetical protein
MYLKAQTPRGRFRTQVRGVAKREQEKIVSI